MTTITAGLYRRFFVVGLRAFRWATPSLSEYQDAGILIRAIQDVNQTAPVARRIIRRKIASPAEIDEFRCELGKVQEAAKNGPRSVRVIAACSVKYAAHFRAFAERHSGDEV